MHRPYVWVRCVHFDLWTNTRLFFGNDSPRKASFKFTGYLFVCLVSCPANAAIETVDCDRCSTHQASGKQRQARIEGSGSSRQGIVPVSRTICISSMPCRENTTVTAPPTPATLTAASPPHTTSSPSPHTPSAPPHPARADTARISPC